jgi:L-lactate dehydrogenase complex protein LldE
MASSDKTVSLFIPCLVDQAYPQIGVDLLLLLRNLGYTVKYNQEQTCCGQPAFNAGHREEALTVARHCSQVFAGDELIVSPSGSCTAMMRKYYPVLFEDDHAWRDEACRVGGNVYEFSEFLLRENQIANIRGHFSARVGFHHSCHSYRELGIPSELPLQILQQIEGVELCQPSGEPVCCGFGGLFSFKFDAVAETMAISRLEQFRSAGAEVIVSNDPGCLMHLRQEAIDRNIDIEILHLVEFLARAMGAKI